MHYFLYLNDLSLSIKIIVFIYFRNIIFGNSEDLKSLKYERVIIEINKLLFIFYSALMFYYFIFNMFFPLCILKFLFP